MFDIAFSQEEHPSFEEPATTYGQSYGTLHQKYIFLTQFYQNMHQLPLHCPNHHAFYEVALEEGIEQDDGKGAGYDDRRFDRDRNRALITCSGCISDHTRSRYDIPQKEHHRKLTALKVDEAVKPVVPKEDGGVESDGCQGGSGER